jgi:hypothetical protein
MNQVESFDPNPFFLAVELGLGAIFVLGRIMRRRFPKLKEIWMDWFEASVLVLTTIVLMRFAFPGWAKVSSVKNALLFIVPYVSIALWTLVMLRFSSALQNAARQIEDLKTKLGSPKIPKADEAHQLPDMTAAAPNKKPSSAPFDPRALHDEILRAMYRKRRLSLLHIEHTTLGPGYSNFVATCPKDFSETWLGQEIEDVSIGRRVRDEIGMVSTLIEDGLESRHQKVVVIVVVNRDLDVSEKASLMGQLEMIKNEDQLSAKMSFRVWDKHDLNS